jgi:DNA polymerase III delta prime subunit
MFNHNNKVKSKNNKGSIVSGDGNKIVNLFVKLIPKSKGGVVAVFGIWVALLASLITIIQPIPPFMNWLFPGSPYWLDSGQGVYQRQDSPAAFTQLTLPSTDSKAQTPLELLSWQRRLTGLIGRDKELRTLSDWAQSEPALSLMLISGGAGTGKTRLAIALAEQLQQSGWQAGLFDLAGKLPLHLQEQGNLLILDDPEQHPKALTKLLSSLARQQPGYRLRLLLVSRRDASAWRSKLDTVGLALSAEISLQTLSQIDSYQLFTQARENAARILQQQAPTPISAEKFQHWLQSNPEQDRRPLYLIATALNSLDQPAWEQLTGIQVIQTLVRQEQARLRRLALASGWEENSLIRLQMLAIIAQGLDAQAILNLAKQPQLELGLPLQGLLDKLQNLSLYTAQTIVPVRPDIVAAAWTASVFKQRPDLAAAWLGAALEQAADIPQALQYLAKLIWDTRNTVRATWHDDWLSELAKGQPGRCKRFGVGLDVNNLATNLTPLGIACTRNLLAQTQSQPEQARLLNNLSIRLAESGDRAAGLTASQRAVETYETLANTNFTAYGPKLAGSLNTHSTRLAESGDRDAGLSAIQRAVEIFEALTKADFTAYGPDLAMSLNNLQ